MPVALVCLASGQPMPNAIAARQVQADRLIILHTDSLRESLEPARQLDRWWRGAGRASDLQPLTHGFRYRSLRRRIGEVLDALAAEAQPPTVIVNVTGGTKLMSLAALDEAEARELAAVYVDTEHNEFLWLASDKPAEPLTVRFSVPEMLELHGSELDTDLEFDEALLSAALTMRRQRHALRQLHRSGQWVWAADDMPMESQMALVRVGLLTDMRRTEDGLRYELGSLAEGIFPNGWLEVLAAEGLRRAGADDLSLSACLIGLQDEMDVLATFGPRLVVVECKTGNVSDESIASLAQDAQRLGGRMALPVLVWSPDRRDSQQQTEIAERCQQRGVRLFLGDRSDALAEAVKTWLQA